MTNEITVFEYDLRDCLRAIDKMRADNPGREDEPIAMTTESENYINGRKSRLRMTHYAITRTFVLTELPPL